MAIRDVVTRGYGNGTYSPGVNDVPVRGYAVNSTADIVKLDVSAAAFVIDVIAYC